MALQFVSIVRVLSRSALRNRLLHRGSQTVCAVTRYRPQQIHTVRKAFLHATYYYYYYVYYCYYLMQAVSNGYNM